VRGSCARADLPRIGIVCSVRLHGRLILETYDFVRTIRPDDALVVGGFHSPMERQALELLLGRRVPVIVVPARNPERMRIPARWRSPMEEGRLTIVSCIGGAARRPTRELALRRNLLVVALADIVLVPCATPGGVAEEAARFAVGCGKRLWTFEDEDNATLFDMGATPAGRLAHTDEACPGCRAAAALGSGG
jgi:hypothetical protein